MKITIFTSLPEFYTGFLSSSIIARTIVSSLVDVVLVDIKEYGIGRYKRIDDYSYGGGGMVMRADILAECIDKNLKTECPFLATSPRGLTFKQVDAEFLSTQKEFFILCNRFEGVDQRILDYYNATEVSIGDYVLCGGEIASCVIMEATIRLLNGAIGNPKTFEEESFSGALNGLLEYDQYTKPSEWRGMKVPEVLQSGNHYEIKKWRIKSSEEKTNSVENLRKNNTLKSIFKK